MKKLLKKIVKLFFVASLILSLVAKPPIAKADDCTESVLSGSVTRNSETELSLTISGEAIGPGPFEIHVYYQGTTTEAGVSPIPVVTGTINETVTVPMPPTGINHLEAVLIDTVTADECQRSNAAGIPGRSTYQPASNPGVNLVDYFILGGPDSPKVAEIYSTPSVLINLIIKNLFVFAGIILFIVIIYSGFKFVYQGSKGKDEAKTILTVAITGFIIMIVAYWIVQIVSIITGTNIPL